MEEMKTILTFFATGVATFVVTILLAGSVQWLSSFISDHYPQFTKKLKSLSFKVWEWIKTIAIIVGVASLAFILFTMIGFMVWAFFCVILKVF